MSTASATIADFRTLSRRLCALARDKDVVGFDVFDTLLRRRLEPETVKDLVARELARRLSTDGEPVDWRLLRHRRRELEAELGTESESEGDDHEFRLHEMMLRWIAQSGGAAADERLADTLCDVELRLEKRATYPTPGIAAALAALRGQGRRLVFVTDIYLDIAAVRELLEHHGLAQYFDAGYCSSNERVTKRSGRLFELVLRREQVSAERFLFVGDNPYSDVDSPVRLGIDAVHVKDRDERKRRLRMQLLDQLSAHNPYWAGCRAQEIVEADSPFIANDPSPDYQLGLLLAPAFLAFTQYVIEQARALGLQRLLFMSREGLTFLRMYRRIVPALGLAGAPDAAYVGVSRLATFLPSMDGLNWAEIERMWRQYDRQSMNRLLQNLSLPVDVFAAHARRCGFDDLDAPIEDPHAHAAFQTFLADAQVQADFTRCRDDARNMLCDYLRRKGLFSADAVGLVDIGWKATIQDNLARAIASAPGRPALHGLYFGLVHVPTGDAPQSFKHGYMADTRRADWYENAIFKNGPVFEMFATARHGGVTGYRRVGSAGRVKPIIRVAETEKRNVETSFATVFSAIEDYTSAYCAVAPLLPVTAAEWKPYLLDQLRRYILYPTGVEARRFLHYSHVENFGVHKVSTYEFKGSWRKMLFGGSPMGAPRRLLATLREQFWPEAVLRRTRLPLVNFLFDLIETRHARKLLPPAGRRAEA